VLPAVVAGLVLVGGVSAMIAMQEYRKRPPPEMSTTVRAVEDEKPTYVETLKHGLGIDKPNANNSAAEFLKMEQEKGDETAAAVLKNVELGE
jgi:hypothetical protein